jgi:multidrug efflux pump subunit AcrB
MFDRIIALSVGNPVFVNLFFALVVVAGIFSATKLPREQFPEISLDRVAVSVAFAGATAQDVEELITKPIEEALDDVADVERIQSLSSEGSSLITITFLEGTDLQSARSEVEKAVATVQNLPEDAETPAVRELKLELPVVSVAVLGDTGAKHVVDRVSEKLRAVDGVSTVVLGGLAERKIFVDLDERELRALGIRTTQITSAIRSAHANVPAGTVERSGSDIFVKTEKRLQSAQDVARIPIFPGSPLRIGDIAKVSDVADPPDTRFWVDGEPAVKLTVGREKTADPLRIREAVVALTGELQVDSPPGIEVRLADDYTSAIRDRLDTVAFNAIGGGVLVLLVLFVMSGARQALLALIGMPVSYLAAIFMMDQASLSINVVSTFGLLIATGIIVDDAVIVIENVQRHLEMGKSRRQATIEGTREVLLPVMVAVLTTCLAFIPLTMVSGTMGRVMKILPLVVIFCLIGSLIEAMFILPGHLADFASTDARDSRTARLVRRMRSVYAPLLRWCMRHRWLTIGLALAGFVGTGAIATKMQFVFGAPGKPYELTIEYEVMPGLDRATTKIHGEGIDALVRQHMGDKILTTSQRVGSILDQQTGLTTTGSNMGLLRWEFEVDEETLVSYPPMIRELREVLATDPELARHAVKEVQAGPPAGAAITARMRGRDIEELNRGLSDMKLALYGMPGVTDIRDNYGSGKETFRVQVDQDRAALHGLTEMDVAEAVRTAVGGVVALEVSIAEDPVDIVVRLAGGRGRSREQLRDVLITNGDGQSIRLDQVATLERTREVGFVRREDGQRTVSALADVDPDVVTAFEASKKIQAFWDEELGDRYPGLSLSFGGEADELRSSLNDLPAAFALAVTLIYMVLALQFRSYVQPFIILSAVPFGLMGAVLGLFLMGHDLSLMALFGIIALVGIVVNDSLVMIDFINTRRREGMATFEAVADGALDRLRPIVSTTLTTCLGLLPLALGLGGRDDVLAPMAVSIAAGLGIATALVLLVVPPIYLVFEDVGSVRRRVLAKLLRRGE